MFIGLHKCTKHILVVLSMVTLDIGFVYGAIWGMVAKYYNGCLQLLLKGHSSKQYTLSPFIHIV